MSTTWDSAPERPQAPPIAPPPQDGGWPPSAPPPEERTGEGRWEAWMAPIALVAALVVATVGGLLVAIVGVLVAGTELDDTPPGVLLGGTLIQDVAFVGAAIVFARMTGPVWAAQFGLRRTSFWWSVLWIFVLYVGFAVFTAIWSTVVEIEEDDILDQFGTDESTLLLVLTGLVVCVGAPLVEEFFFRGFFFTALRNWRGLWPAAIITGIVFGGIHAVSSPVGALVPLMVFGFGLCLLYAKTGSLYPCIAVHAINNAIAFSVMNDWDWQVPLVIVGSLAVCALVAIPLADRWRPPAATSHG